jgi:hypothetical protein
LDKALIRQAKAAHRAMKYQSAQNRDHVDVACVIHGAAYDWIYVERLYNMVRRNLSTPVRFHVYTEHDRSVPPHMIKHCLEEWPGIAGPRKSWWYKLQLFNPEHFTGDLLYFDLDTVIVNDIQWILSGSTDCFWTLRDFRYLQRGATNTLNSSVMWFNVERFSALWHRLETENIQEIVRRMPGDQDYITRFLDHNQVRFLPRERVISWRWQAQDGGYDFATRRHRAPGRGTEFSGDVSVLVFHGRPKPHQISDPVISRAWC